MPLGECTGKKNNNPDVNNAQKRTSELKKFIDPTQYQLDCTTNKMLKFGLNKQFYDYYVNNFGVLHQSFDFEEPRVHRENI
jgi:hypothetical protein